MQLNPNPNGPTRGKMRRVRYGKLNPNVRHKRKPLRDPAVAQQMAEIRARGPQAPGNIWHMYKKYLETPYREGVDRVKVAHDLPKMGSES